MHTYKSIIFGMPERNGYWIICGLVMLCGSRLTILRVRLIYFMWVCIEDYVLVKMNAGEGDTSEHWRGPRHGAWSLSPFWCSSLSHTCVVRQGWLIWYQGWAAGVVLISFPFSFPYRPLRQSTPALPDSHTTDSHFHQNQQATQCFVIRF